MQDSCEVLSNVEVTQLLKAWGERNEGALQRLMPLVEAELHGFAHRHMRREKPGHMLQRTALMSEVYLRLVYVAQVSWQDRAHFFNISARTMRRILTDFARSRNYQKRRGAALHVSFDEALAISQEKDADIVAIDDALIQLAALDSRKSQVVELRFFGGLSIEEVAEVLKVSPESVKRDRRFVKPCLHRALSGEKGDETGALAAS